jgi:fatty acid synthase
MRIAQDYVHYRIFSLQDVKGLFEKTNNNKFTIVGISFGALLALEFAKMLEKINMNGQLILIDGAPDYFKYAGYEKTFLADYESQTELISRVIEVTYPERQIDLLMIMKEDCDLKEKLDKVLLEICGNEEDPTADIFRKFLNGIFNRVKITVEYDDSHLQAIKSKITLIRSRESLKLDIDEAFGLNKYTSNDIIVVEVVDGSHVTMLDSDDLPRIINENLLN